MRATSNLLSASGVPADSLFGSGENGLIDNRTASTTTCTRNASPTKLKENHMSEGWSFETKQIHAGQAPDGATNAFEMPIYQTTS